MKQIVSVSLGPSQYDYEFEEKFLGRIFNVKRIGTDDDVDAAIKLVKEWEHKADAIGIGDVAFRYRRGSSQLEKKLAKQVTKLQSWISSPIITGERLHRVSLEWAIRHVQVKHNNAYFNHSRVLFLSGLLTYHIAKAISEYTANLTFADPIFENGIAKFINSLDDFDRYIGKIHELLNWIPSRRLLNSAIPLKMWNAFIVRNAIRKSHIVVVPSSNFYNYLNHCGIEELSGKTVISSTVYEDRIRFLKERGVDVIIDCTPKILEHLVGCDVLEAMIAAGNDIPFDKLTEDDLLDVISKKRMRPRIIYPSGEFKRINRFAFVIHPLSQEYLKKDPTINLISRYTPRFSLDVIEKVMAYSPPLLYSKVTGIKSPLGNEAEGWLIAIGGTPKEMLAHSPEFTYKRLLQAADMAKRLGAQIMGLGAFSKVVGDAGDTVAKQADIPITTGNSYSASGALWAATDAVRRMGLINKVEKGKKLKAKAMVVGASGSIGSVCCRLMAMMYTEIYMVDVRHARLLALKESILSDTPDAKIAITTNPDKYLADMDVIVTATSAAGKKVIDIMQVKPGCVIADVARPLDLSAEDVASRPDVLVIESGEILLPGDVEMRDIGLPPKVAFACLAETIVLALEGRFENYTVGRDIKWQKVEEIYRLGLKHGMKLAAISGHKGPFSDEDIAEVARLARKARGLEMREKHLQATG